MTHTDHERDSTFAYDTVWMAALALHRTEIDLQGQEPSRSLNNFTYHSKDIQEIIYRHALNTRFNGASVSCVYTYTVKYCDHIFIYIYIYIYISSSLVFISQNGP